MLAEALVGDLAEPCGGDGRRAATALAQLIGPFRAAHGRFPTVPELRELLDGPSGVLDALRAALACRAAQAAQLRELDAHERQSGRARRRRRRCSPTASPCSTGPPSPASSSPPTPPAPATARSPCARWNTRCGSASTCRSAATPRRPASWPGWSSPSSPRQPRRARTARCSPAWCSTTPRAPSPRTPLRGLQRLRSAHAGAVLTLRALDDVPQPLRAPLLGAVGCRMVCAGVTPWDAEHFAEVWGTEWVQTRDVTNRQLVSDEPFTRLMHAVRRLATGKHVTAESVTVRTVQRRALVGLRPGERAARPGTPCCR